MLNVRRERPDAVLGVLPALKNPTISTLSDPEWVAVNTIIEESVVRQILPRLKSRQSAGDRRISLEQNCAVMKILKLSYNPLNAPSGGPPVAAMRKRIGSPHESLPTCASAATPRCTRWTSKFDSVDLAHGHVDFRPRNCPSRKLRKP